LKQKKPRRAAGTRTASDVLRDFVTLRRMSDKRRSDIEAMQQGEHRWVKCYFKPRDDESRRQWKPGHLDVSAGELRWEGSSRRWEPFTLRAGEWATSTRNVTRQDHVYSYCRVIKCVQGSEAREFAVPRPDAELCLVALGYEPHSYG
jgi:hypothetical protein